MLSRIITQFIYQLTQTESPSFFIQSLLKIWVFINKIDLSEYETPNPNFKNLSQIHLRELKSGSRKIATSEIIFPCDGKLIDLGSISSELKLHIKGLDYFVRELLNTDGDNGLSNFSGGYFLNIYLPPAGYHHWHAPVEGSLTKSFFKDGALYSVNPLFSRFIKKIYTKNKRQVEHYETKQQEKIVLIAIGAVGVGNLILNYRYQDLPLNLDKGQKTGSFGFGSTIILLIPSKFKLKSDLKTNQWVKMGEAVTQV